MGFVTIQSSFGGERDADNHGDHREHDGDAVLRPAHAGYGSIMPPNPPLCLSILDSGETRHYPPRGTLSFRPCPTRKLRAEIDDLLREDRTVDPPVGFHARAVVRDEGIYAEADAIRSYTLVSGACGLAALRTPE